MSTETHMEFLARDYAERKLAYEQAGMMNTAYMTAAQQKESSIAYARLRDDYHRAERKYEAALKDRETLTPPVSAPIAVAPVWKPITATGQVRVGDKLRFKIGNDEYLETAKQILAPGTAQEEIIYNKSKNYYLITSMAIAGTGSQKSVEFLVAAPQSSAVPVAAVQVQEDDGLVRYCPGCGSVGDVDYAKHRDCCPDGDMAFKVPHGHAKQSHLTFQAAIKNIASGADAIPLARAYADQHKMAVTTDWLAGFDFCRDIALRSPPMPAQANTPSSVPDDDLMNKARAIVPRLYNDTPSTKTDVEAGEIIQWFITYGTNARALQSPPISDKVGVLHGIVAGALFDFCGMLTTQDDESHFSAHHEAGPAVQMIKRFAAKRGLKLEPCDVLNWQAALSQPSATPHSDDNVIDDFAVLMKQKMQVSRDKGRRDWDDPKQISNEALSDMLRAHVIKGDPIDVANFCMMLAARCSGILQPPAVEAQAPTVRYLEKAMKSDIPVVANAAHTLLDYYQGFPAVEAPSELPPLPKPAFSAEYYARGIAIPDIYTADQMREYGKQCAALPTPLPKAEAANELPPLPKEDGFWITSPWWLEKTMTAYGRDCYAAALAPSAAQPAQGTQAVSEHIVQMIEDLTNYIESPPDRNCSCHISPPCRDCVDYSHLRDLLERAKVIAAAPKPPAVRDGGA